LNFIITLENIMPVIDEIVSKIEHWKGKNISIQALSGGLTNANYKVTVNEIPFFVRVPGESTALLAIDRRNEYFNAQAAAETGVGPKVLYYLPEFKAMVLEFVQGTTMSNDDLNKPGMPTRIAVAIHRLHAGPRFLSDFNMFRLTEYYLNICRKRGIRIPDGYPERLATIGRIEQALLIRPPQTVPCNNDLLAENYIDDGKAMRIIDYEYSGNNDPCFELGNTCQELGYDEARIIEVCKVYFGGSSPSMISRMKLNMIMSDVGWSLWAAIQADISKINYNFWGWAVERWGRAVSKMDAPEFPSWLEDVRT
jgi:thiamine kinase-like enzyme